MLARIVEITTVGDMDIAATPRLHRALDLVGNTPLLLVEGMGTPYGVEVAIKCEWMNPAGSIKDRTAVEMVNQAEARGDLKPGGVIIEATSGNTGAGLAMVAAQRGYRCVLVCSDKVSPEKVALLRALGAEVHICPVAVAPEDPRSYYSVAARLERELPGAWQAGQYANPDNVAAHEHTTGPEIWRDTAGKVTAVVASAGTGGTMTGLSRYLKAQNPDVRIYAADAAGSVYSGGDGRPYLLEGAGEDFWPETYDPQAPDEVIAVSDFDAFDTARRYAKAQGILLGGSGGAALWAALEVARRSDPGDLIVVIAPDSGRAYLSRFYDEGWYATHGFSEPAPGVETVASALSAKTADTFAWVEPTATVEQARELIAKTGAGVLPVLVGAPPAVPAEVRGTVFARQLSAPVWVPGTQVQELMGPALPLVGVAEALSKADALAAEAGAVLVLEHGRLRWVYENGTGAQS